MKAILFLINAGILLIRTSFVIFGLVLVIDGGLSARTEQLHVESHHSAVSNSNDEATKPGKQYTINFSGDKERSCSVSDSVYGSLHDGDTVILRTSGLINHCLEIRRGDITVMPFSSWWRWCCLIGGLFCVAAALFGKIGFADDDDPSVVIRVE